MLAIIIPYYKITYFEETLKSLVGQTDKRFNVYIGDDASPEKPQKLIKKYGSQINLTYKRFDSNIGSISLIKQWERSIALSNDEEWLLLLGDDDILDVNVVEEFYSLLDGRNNSKIDLIRFNLKIINAIGDIQTNDYTYEDHESSQRFLERLFTPNETITASEFVFSRRVYKEKEGFVNYPLAWFSDYSTWLNFAENSGIFNVTSASVFWRLSKINISSKTANLYEIGQKTKSLFMFITFVDKNYKVEKSIKKKFIHNQLNYLFSYVKLINMCQILIKQMFKYNLKFTFVIVKFIVNKINKRISKI